LPGYWPKGLCPKCALDGALEEPANHLPPSRSVGQYELLEEVARGGMGVVYRARQVSLDRIVALKMILAGQFAGKQEVLRFRSEAEAAAHLQHPNIVRIHETGEHEGHHYFSMDLVEGRTLTEIVRDGPLSAQRAAKYACRIAQAIHYAHSQGVLHRDLKPSNVIIDAHDEPRITDFGLAKRMRNDFGVTVTGQVLGSPNFMPPEQTSAKHGKVAPTSDVYGIGAILYYLLTGRPPFHAETIEELLLLLRDAEPVLPRLLNTSVPHDLETICLKCLEKEPARRYPTAEALADELHRFIRDEPIQARPLPVTGKLWRWCRRRPAVAGLSASVLVLLVIVTLGSSIAAWRVNRARTSERNANRDLRHTISLLELERAEDLFSNHDSSAGVAHLAAILRRDPSNSIAAHRLVSALAHRNWAVPSIPPILHIQRVTRVMFHPNGTHLLTASLDNVASVWDVSTGRQVFVLRSVDRVTTAQYSPGGERILTVSSNGVAQIWDAASGEPCGSPLRHDRKIYSAEFSPDGKWIVTASADRTARIWNAADGALKHELRQGSHVILARFSRDAQKVVTGGSHGSIRIWSVDSGKVLRQLEDRHNPLKALAFSPDGRLVVTACDDGIARVWDAATGESAAEPLRHRTTVWHAVFSPDGKFLLTTCEDGAARVWDTQTWRLASEPLQHESGVTFGEFSPDGTRVVTTSSDNTARVWDVKTGTPIFQPLRHVERVLHASFSSDGRCLVTASYDGAAQVWDLRRPVDPALQIPRVPDVAPFAFGANGTALLSVAPDHTARLWHLRTGRPLNKPIAHDSPVWCGDCSRDGQRIVLACADGTIRVWKTGDGDAPQLIAGPFRHSNAVLSVKFDADASRIVTASADGTARVWEVAGNRPVTLPLPHHGPVLLAQFSPNGRLVVTASEDSTAGVWDAQTGHPVTEPLTHIDHVKWADFSPNGETVVTASTDNTACIWDVRTGRPILPPLQHPRIVQQAVFSHDAEWVVTACADRRVRIWDVRSGRSLTPPLVHDSGIARVFFSKNDEHVVTVCRSGLARFWDSKTGRPLTEWLNAGSYWSACFEAISEQIAVGTRTGGLRTWQMLRIPTPVPDWFPAFAEALGGTRLGERGTMELSSPEKLREFQRQTAGRKPSNIYEQIAHDLLDVPEANVHGVRHDSSTIAP
jgi:eukaryotic-like serine/threonine-protein kinase